MIPFSLIIFVSVGLIMVDFATASEAAALGVLAALIESFWYRKMGWRDYLQAAGESAVLSAVILIIIATAILLGQVLAFTGVVQELGNAIAASNANRWLLFFFLMLLPFILCIFVDQIAIMMILIPIYDPLIKTLGFDPVWFWMQFLIIMVAGSITPPFGYIIFALKAAVPEVSLTELYPPAWLFTVRDTGGRGTVHAISRDHHGPAPADEIGRPTSRPNAWWNMKRSTDRILTTHVGSLIRPQALQEIMRAKQAGQALRPGRLRQMPQGFGRRGGAPAGRDRRRRHQRRRVRQGDQLEPVRSRTAVGLRAAADPGGLPAGHSGCRPHPLQGLLRRARRARAAGQSETWSPASAR